MGEIETAIEQKIDEIHERRLAVVLPTLVAQEVSRLTEGLSDEAREMREICAQEFLTKEQATKFLQISESTIDTIIKDDPTFPVGKVGRQIRIHRESLIQWTREQGRRRPKAA